MSIWHWLIVLGVFILIFVTKPFGTAGTDIENAILNFKRAMHSPKKFVGIAVVVGSILVLCLLILRAR